MDYILLSSAQGGDAGTINLIMIGMMFIVIYFFLIRPQSKRQKEQQNFVNSIEKGDNVITTSGIHGRVMKIEEDVITLEVYKNTYIKIERSAISKDFSAKLVKEEE